MKRRWLTVALCATALAGAAGARVAAEAATAGAAVASPTPATAQIARGEYLAALGDCVPCHTQAGGKAFAGGRGLNSPFGTIYSANITPDTATGIGGWSAQQFYRALHEGQDAAGNHLYPAFPYPYFTRITRADSDALFAYLASLEPVVQARPANRLQFPLTLRSVLGIWNALYLRVGEFQPTRGQSEEWNRGAYIVTGLGHCGACHTPKNLAGADRTALALGGGTLDDWYAADLTETPRAGLAAWSLGDIVEFLKTGRNARATASGPMQEVVQHSTSLMNDVDLRAVAVYLKDQPARTVAGSSMPPDAADLQVGSAIFTDECSACHRSQALGVPELFPPLAGDSLLQSRDATTVVRIVLDGSRSPATAARSTALTMPAFAWKLDDRQVAAVASFIRNSWGNQAPAVDAATVQRLRARLARRP